MDKYGDQGFLYVYAIYPYLVPFPITCADIGARMTGDGVFLEDVNSDVFQLYKDPSTGGIPQTVFIDRQMKVRYTEVGFNEVSDPAAFSAYIEELLAE